MDLNKVTLIGNMVRDPETAQRGDGRVTRFSLATNYAWQDQKTKTKREAIDFHEVVASGKLGDIIQQYVKRGAKLYIEGHLRKQTSTAKGGARRTTALIIAESIILLGHRPRSGARAPELLREEMGVDEIEETGR